MQSVKHLKPEDQIRAMSLFEGQEDFKPFHIKEEDEKKSDKKQEAVSGALDKHVICITGVFEIGQPLASHHCLNDIITHYHHKRAQRNRDRAQAQGSYHYRSVYKEGDTRAF